MFTSFAFISDNLVAEMNAHAKALCAISQFTRGGSLIRGSVKFSLEHLVEMVRHLLRGTAKSQPVS